MRRGHGAQGRVRRNSQRDYVWPLQQLRLPTHSVRGPPPLHATDACYNAACYRSNATAACYNAACYRGKPPCAPLDLVRGGHGMHPSSSTDARNQHHGHVVTLGAQTRPWFHNYTTRQVPSRGVCGWYRRIRLLAAARVWPRPIPRRGHGSFRGNLQGPADVHQRPGSCRSLRNCARRLFRLHGWDVRTTAALPCVHVRMWPCSTHDCQHPYRPLPPSLSLLLSVPRRHLRRSLSGLCLCCSLCLVLLVSLSHISSSHLSISVMVLGACCSSLPHGLTRFG